MNKYFFRNLTSVLGLVLGSRTAEVVEADIEPVINVAVQPVVLVTDLLWRQTLLYRLRLRRGSILVCSADIQDVVVPQPTKPEQILTHNCMAPTVDEESNYNS